jgi:chloride channel protein, CIC family
MAATAAAFALPRVHRLQQPAQLGADLSQFLEVRRRQLVDQRFAPRGQRHVHAPAIHFRWRASHQSAFGEPVDQADGAVVPQVQALGQGADGHGIGATGETLQREQRLMLLRWDSGVVRRLFAEPEKPAQRVAQGGELLVIRGSDFPSRHGGTKAEWVIRDNGIEYIVARCNRCPFPVPMPHLNPTLPVSASPAGRPLADFRTDRRVLLLSALAVPIGAIGALVAKALIWLIAVITNAAFYLRISAAPVTPRGHHLGWWVILVPVVGALIIGLMARYGSEKIRGHGIPEALEAILLGRSLIDPKVALLKPISSAISIGTGGPFGAEGPIIMTGGAFGSIFAQLFHLSAAERKTLLVAGAAAGMAAVFATPIAAVLIAVELLLFEWKPRSFIPVAVAAVVASILRVPLLGAGPIFPVVAHAQLSASALGVAALVGIVAGLVSGLLTLIVYGCEDAFEKLPIHWMWWPALGAIVVGIGGILDPRVLGVGYDTIHQLMRGEISGGSLAALLFAKGIVWAVALGSGTSGGVLAPLLMIGGAVGAALGSATGVGDAGLWAMVGMAGMMGGTMRSPLTGMVFVLELTHDLNVLPGLLIGSVAGLCVTVLLLKRSILTEKLARRGQHIAREYSVDVFELARVGEVMDQTPPIVPGKTPALALADRIARGDPAVSRRQATLLTDDAGRLIGIVTRGDLMRAQVEGRGLDALEAGSRDLVVAFPDETLQDAFTKMLRRGVGRLPVVSREDPARIVGYLGRADILAARARQHDEEEHRERGPLLGVARNGG